MTKPVRVLQVIGKMDCGGAEAMLMNYYRKIDRTRIQFDFVENCDERAAFDDEIERLGGRIFRCPRFDGLNYIRYRKWWTSFFREHPDEYTIVHGHIGSCAGIYLREAKKAGCFTIAHSHNTGTVRTIKGMLYKAASFSTRYIADYFLACSVDAGRCRFGKNVVQQDHFAVMNNAINTPAYKADASTRESVRGEFGFRDEIVVGHVGRFAAQKNHRFLIDVFDEVIRRNPNVKLLLVGGGELEDAIRQMVHERNLEAHVIFAGIRPDVNRVMQAMDVFVFPSLFEGLPLALVEAQTVGMPCVISDKVPGDGILVDALVEVMRLSEAPEKWAERILARANEPHLDTQKQIIEKGFDIGQNAEWLEAFYLEHA